MKVNSVQEKLHQFHLNGWILILMYLDWKKLLDHLSLGCSYDSLDDPLGNCNRNLHLNLKDWILVRERVNDDERVSGQVAWKWKWRLESLLLKVRKVRMWNL